MPPSSATPEGTGGLMGQKTMAEKNSAPHVRWNDRKPGEYPVAVDIQRRGNIEYG